MSKEILKSNNYTVCELQPVLKYIKVRLGAVGLYLNFIAVKDSVAFYCLARRDKDRIFSPVWRSGKAQMAGLNVHCC